MASLRLREVRQIATDAVPFSHRILHSDSQFSYLTAEAPFDFAQDRLRTLNKELLIKNYSELSVLYASAVNTIFSSLVTALPRWSTCSYRRLLPSPVVRGVFRV